MERKLFLLLAAFAFVSFLACGKPPTFELALITNASTVDDKSFNQGSWEGLARYARENGISHKYFQPSEKSDYAFVSSIDLAVRGGAKLIVVPGFLFEVPVYIAQDIYPDVKFVLVDGVPHNNDYSLFYTANNTVGIVYSEEEAGFLAGYAAVKEGMKSLGYMGGMAVPPVVSFGYGFVYGAEIAAKELGYGRGDVTISYHYTGSFEANPAAQTMAASWYRSGIEVIFACGGSLGNSVMAAAEQEGTVMIGVDIDQSFESPTVITSAVKGLSVSVYDSIKAFYEGRFPGGQAIEYNAKLNGVGLPMETSRFKNFSKADYDAIFARVATGEFDIPDDTTHNSASEIQLDIVIVTERR
ncbi:MAG: BMP family ABC transporter substrate-binding protein [Treponema sp.]|nr:BMP family ABC transporter substrate-binding protein [Treponema sp.]